MHLLHFDKQGFIRATRGRHQPSFIASRQSRPGVCVCVWGGGGHRFTASSDVQTLIIQHQTELSERHTALSSVILSRLKTKTPITEPVIYHKSKHLEKWLNVGLDVNLDKWSHRYRQMMMEMSFQQIWWSWIVCYNM